MDKLFIDVEPIDTGAIRGTLRQVIRKEDGTVCVEADVTWATVNTQGRPSKLPKEFLVPGLYPEKQA